ncbi:MAG: glycosyltransferase family 39 protein, partial [Pseudomonadota bacterium]
MTATPTSAASPARGALTLDGRAFAIAAVAVSAIRIMALFFSDIDLGPDETQYWFWAQTPDLGYYSKPPFIAWSIAATTAVFGDAEWAVRLSAPLFHLGGATFLFLAARRLFGDEAGFWVGLLWCLAPGVAVSSVVIATDAPLLFFWTAALYAWICLSETYVNGVSSTRVALMLGAAVGFGLLAKYAMIYFLIGAALAAVIAKRRPGARDALIAAATAATVFAPNLIWNAENDFQTVGHTAANADWSGALFRIGDLAAFLGAQFGVFGPVAMGLFIAGLAGFRARLKNAGGALRRELALLCFVA